MLAAAMQRELGDVVSFDVPAGGTALWARVEADGVDVDRWLARARARGVDFQTARTFTFDGRARPYARFGFAPLEPAELRRAVGRLRESLRG